MNKYESIFTKFIIEEYTVKFKLVDNIAVLCFSIGKENIDFNHILKVFPDFNEINLNVIRDLNYVKVPLKNITIVLEQLEHMKNTKKLNIIIDKKIKMFKIQEINKIDFLSYIYDKKLSTLNLQINNDFEFMLGICKYKNKIYKTKISEKDGELKKQYVGNEIIDFLNSININNINNIKTDLKISNEVIFKLEIKEIEKEKIEINPLWKEKINVKKIEKIENVNNYYIYDKCIYKGMTEEYLKKIIKKTNRPFYLNRKEMKEFVNENYKEIKEFVNENKIYKYMPKDIKVKQYVYFSKEGLINKTMSLPYIYIENKKIEAYEISKSMSNNDSEILNIFGNEIYVKSLKEAGIGISGRAVDGTPLFLEEQLTAKEILSGGAERFNNICSEMDFFNIKWDIEGTISEKLEHYFKLLMNMGISGGVINYDQDNYYDIGDIITNIRKEYLNSRVLVIGKIDEIKKLEKYNFTIIKTVDEAIESGNMENNLVAIIPTMLIKTRYEYFKWDIVFFINPEEIYKTPGSRLYRATISIKSKTRLCITREKLNNMPYSTANVISKIMKFKEGIEILDYLIREINIKMQLPNQYVFRNSRKIRNQLIVSPKIKLGIKNEFYNNKNTWSYRKIENTFKEDSLKNIDRYEEKAEEYPYYTNVPSYADMNENQQKWYFFWRQNVRKENYIKTDIGYIILYIFELINDIWGDDYKKTYERLLDIWEKYSKFHSFLNKYIGQWVFDYAILHNIDLNLKDLVIRMTKTRSLMMHTQFNMAIMKMVEIKDEDIPICIIKSLSSYTINKSKFLNKNNIETVNSVIVDCFNNINKIMKQKNGVGIFETFKPHKIIRTKHTPYETYSYILKKENYTIDQLPYMTHDPLIKFIGNIIRYIENLLRKEFKYIGKLKTEFIEDEILQEIHECFKKRFGRVILATEKKIINEKEENIKEYKPIKKVRITIDKNKVLKAEKDSNMILEKLIEVKEIEQELDHIEEEIKNIDMQSESLEDNESLESVFLKLKINQREIIDAIFRKENMLKIQEVATMNGDILEILIDEINEVSYEIIGDLLIDITNQVPVINEEYIEDIKKILGGK